MTDNTAPQGVKAGWHIWLVGIIGILWNGFGSLDFTLTTMRVEAWLAPYPKAVVDHIFSLPWWMFGLWAVGVFGGLAASIALLMKSKAAATLFPASLIAAMVSFVVNSNDPDAPKMEGTDIIPYMVIVLALIFAAYAFWQQRRGVLR